MSQALHPTFHELPRVSEISLIRSYIAAPLAWYLSNPVPWELRQLLLAHADRLSRPLWGVAAFSRQAQRVPSWVKRQLNPSYSPGSQKWKWGAGRCHEGHSGGLERKGLVFIFLSSYTKYKESLWSDTPAV